MDLLYDQVIDSRIVRMVLIVTVLSTSPVCHKSLHPCLSLQDAGSQQIGFLLGSCGVSLALTSEVCLKGLPKTPNGEIIQFKGQLA